MIKRFSEDVDLTYDNRAIAPDLIEKADSPWPTSRSQEKKWSKAIQQRLAELVSGTLAPDLAKALAEHGLPAKARAEGEQIFIDNEAFGEGTSAWLRTACSWTTPNPSTSCCSVARRLRSR